MFHNIFSKKDRQEEYSKKEKSKSKNKIIVDHREKNSLIQLGHEIEFSQLEIGDYLINGTVIERKTVQDFISSMLNKRLLRQIENLTNLDSKLLLVEGIEENNLYQEANEESEIKLHPNSIRGFLLSITLKDKIPLIFTKNSEDTAKFLDVLARKKPSNISLKLKRRPLNEKEHIQFIIESFPGIGPKTAQKLLKEFKTINNIINASEEDLKKVIGKKSEAFRLVKREFN